MPFTYKFTPHKKAQSRSNLPRDVVITTSGGFQGATGQGVPYVPFSMTR